MDNKNQYRRWTRSAIECYQRGCVCEGCLTGQIIEQTCRMKITVRELVKRLGPPPKSLNLIPGATQQEENIVTAILEGAGTLKQIADNLELNYATIQQRLYSLYRLIENNGYQFKTSKQRNRLPEFIEYVKTLQPNDDTPAPNIILDEETELKGKEIMYDKDLNLEYPNYMAPIIDAMKKGYEKVAEIANQSGVGNVAVSVAINQFAHHLEKLGLITLTKDRKIRQTIINFIQSRLLDPEYKEEVKIEQLPNNDKSKEKIAIGKTENNSDDAELKIENEKLRKRISELENQAQTVVKYDFSSLKSKINQEIMLLTQKLNLIEELEKDVLL